MSTTPEDRLANGEASELDLLIIVTKLGEDLLEAKDALEALWEDIGATGRHQTSTEVERKVLAALWKD